MNLPFGYTLRADFHGGFLVFLGLFLMILLLIVFMNKQRVVRQGSISRLIYLSIIFSRLTVSLGILLLIFDPELRLERERELPKRVAVLLDQSSSMKNAWEENEAELSIQIKNFIDRLDDRYPVDALSLAGEIIEVEDIQFADDYSALEWKPQLQGDQTSKYHAVFLISDGHMNQGRSPLDAPWTSSLPIFPVLPLNPRSNQLLELEEVSYTRTEEDGNPIQVKLRIHQRGLIGKRATLSILNQSGETLADEDIRLDKVYSLFSLPVVLDQTRAQQLLIRASLDEGGLVSEKTLLIAQEKAKKRVLLASETLDLTHKFLSLNLPDSVYERIISVGDGENLISDAIAAEGFDLIILNEPAKLVLNNIGTQLIQDAMVQNTPILLFSSGETRLDPEWLSLLNLEQERSTWVGELSVTWDNGSNEQPLFLGLLGVGYAPEQISSYPPVQRGEHVLMGAGASLLSANPGEAQESILWVANDPPMIVFNGGSFWKWLFYPEARQSFHIFWSYLLDYLTAIEDFQPVQLSIDKEIAETGEQVPVRLAVRDVDGTPLLSEVNIWQEDQQAVKRPLDVNREEIGSYAAQLFTRGSGDFYVIGEAYRFGELWGRDTSRISLTTFNEEGQTEGVDKIFLQRLAEHSNGGSLIIASDNPPIFPAQTYVKKTTMQLQGLRSANLFYLIFILLILEWVIRRRNGLL